MRFDRAFVRDPAAAGFIAVAAFFLFYDGDAVPMSPNPFVDWGQLLPNYTIPASASNSCSRVRDSSEWVMIADGGLVITDKDWEVNKGLSYSSVIEAMDVSALLEHGFHPRPRECFPAAPTFLRRSGGVPSGSAFPLLWFLRFFGCRIYGREGPDGSHPASAAEKRRLDMTVRAELELFVALGVVSESKANQRTQVFPVGLINMLLGYNRVDEIPTHGGSLSIRATAERLMKARPIDPSHHVTERPLHVTSLLYYVPDALLDDGEIPVPAAPQPSREPAIPRRSPFADPGALTRAIDVDSGSRSPVVPRRALPALPLQLVAPPWSPSFTVSPPPALHLAPVSVPPPTQGPAPSVPSGRHGFTAHHACASN